MCVGCFHCARWLLGDASENVWLRDTPTSRRADQLFRRGSKRRNKLAKLINDPSTTRASRYAGISAAFCFPAELTSLILKARGELKARSINGISSSSISLSLSSLCSFRVQYSVDCLYLTLSLQNCALRREIFRSRSQGLDSGFPSWCKRGCLWQYVDWTWDERAIRNFARLFARVSAQINWNHIYGIVVLLTLDSFCWVKFVSSSSFSRGRFISRFSHDLGLFLTDFPSRSWNYKLEVN